MLITLIAETNGERFIVADAVGLLPIEAQAKANELRAKGWIITYQKAEG